MRKWYNKLFLNDIRRANDDFSLIEDGDHVLIGLSGGKDSIFLLYSLILLKNRSHLNFEISVAHIDIGLELNFSSIKKFTEKNDISLIYRKIDILESLESEKNPCFFCSRMKRGTLSSIAKEINANKIAIGHHLNDFLETFFLNIVKENNFRVFNPKSYNKKHGLFLIRPLVYVKEETILKVVKEESLPLVLGELCFYDSENERNKINLMIKEMRDFYPDIENSLLQAIKKNMLTEE